MKQTQAKSDEHFMLCHRLSSHAVRRPGGRADSDSEVEPTPDGPARPGRVVRHQAPIDPRAIDPAHVVGTRGRSAHTGGRTRDHARAAWAGVLSL